MTPIRVLVVDDSLITRRLVQDALADVAGLEVVGAAPNGRVGLAMARELRPDVVTLDVEMPELGGIETLRQLRAALPRVRVIMFSSLTGPAAPTALEALAAGAADCVAKPVAGGMNAARASIRESLLPRIEAMCAPVVRASEVRTSRAHVRNARLVAIGTSTGGPAALHALLSGLSADFVAPIAIVQHIPPMFSRLLAERLQHACGRRVIEVTEATPLMPRRVYLAPADRHLVVARRHGELVMTLDDAPPEGSCRPSVDVLLRSAAACFAEDALGVILTGMGQDGLHGCEALRAAGGRIFVQDAASSVVWGMPGAVARAGLAERILPLDAMADAIELACRKPAIQEHRAGC